MTTPETNPTPPIETHETIGAMDATEWDEHGGPVHLDAFVLVPFLPGPHSAEEYDAAFKLWLTHVSTLPPSHKIGDRALTRPTRRTRS